MALITNALDTARKRLSVLGWTGLRFTALRGAQKTDGGRLRTVTERRQTCAFHHGRVQTTGNTSQSLTATRDRRSVTRAKASSSLRIQIQTNALELE